MGEPLPATDSAEGMQMALQWHNNQDERSKFEREGMFTKSMVVQYFFLFNFVKKFTLIYKISITRLFKINVTRTKNNSYSLFDDV